MFPVHPWINNSTGHGEVGTRFIRLKYAQEYLHLPAVVEVIYLQSATLVISLQCTSHHYHTVRAT